MRDNKKKISTTPSANGFILVSLFFHSLIFLFLKLGSQSKDWLFLFIFALITNVLCHRTWCFCSERCILKPPLIWWFFYFKTLTMH